MLLGYLFILPALVVTAVFGLFPVISGLTISMQGGIILPEGFIGLGNYFEAIGSLAYLLGLIIALVLLFIGYRLFRASYLIHRGRFYPYLAPGAFAALATLLLCGAFFGGFHQLDIVPAGLLLLALVMYAGLELRSHAGPMTVLRSWGTLLLTLSAVLLILFTFSEIDASVTPALNVLGQATGSFVMPLATCFVALLGVAASLGAAFAARVLREKTYWNVLRWVMFAIAGLLVTYIIGGIELLRESTVQLGRADLARLATLTSLSAADLVQRVLVWPQVFTILLGTALVGLAFYLWVGATRPRRCRGLWQLSASLSS
jgi:ABC-type sugar transport system permease subunit